MYKGTLSGRTELIIHLIFWALIAYFKLVGNPLQSSYVAPDLFFITYAIVFAATFYFHYLLVMKQIFKSFQWRKLLAGILISYLFFTGLRWLIEQAVTGILFGKINYINPTFFNYMLDNLGYSSIPLIFSSFLWLAIYFVRLLEYNKIILEENKNTEIKFLKAQINPHFVFNTLNNIYSMVYFQSDKSLTAIEKLSQIMQFTTYESQKEKIKLSDEINYIQAYIELEQLRHPESTFVEVNIETANASIEIPPYILSPLVENALKHAITSSTEPIIIELSISLQKLTFEVKNKIGTQQKDKLGGIGLDNLKRRLEIHYPGRHALQITDTTHFTAKLQIDLC